MSLHHPTVAIVGATGAVGAELIGCLETPRLPAGAVAPVRLRPFGRAQAAVPRPGHRGGGAERGQLSRRRYRAVLGRRRGVAAVRADRGAAGRGGGRQLLGVPHGPRRAAGGAGGEPRRDRAPYRHHRQSELRGDRRRDGALAAAPAQPHPPGDRRDLSGGVGRRRGGDGGTARLDRRVPGRQPNISTACWRIPMRSTCSATTRRVDPASGYNEEETKVMRELRKIMDEPELRIGVTCVRVPVLRAHSIALTVEFERPIAPDAGARGAGRRAGRADRR